MNQTLTPNHIQHQVEQLLNRKKQYERITHMNNKLTPNEIKAKLSMLGKKQVDLVDELNTLGGCYHVPNRSMLSDVINNRRSGAKAETLMLKINQIINTWESEGKKNAG
jgi:hypothetical protein